MLSPLPACSLINSGRKILLASGDWRTHATLRAISEEFNLPYVNWVLPPRSPGRLEVSIYPPVYYAAADFIVWKKWDRLIYVFDTEAGKGVRIQGQTKSLGLLFFLGIWNQRALIATLRKTQHREMAIESIQLPHWKSNNSAPDYFRFFLDFHARYFIGDHYVILDVERSETLKKILLDLQDAAMKTKNFHYLIASYVSV